MPGREWPGSRARPRLRPSTPSTTRSRRKRCGCRRTPSARRSDRDRGVRLAPAVDDPAPLPIAQKALFSGLGGRAVFDLHVDPRGLLRLEQLLLERLPIGGVIDVAGEVAL